MSTIPRLVVFDFDGTCTDAEKEGEGFVTGVIATLSEITGRGTNTIRDRYKDAERCVLADPSRFDWVIDGIAVCPGTLDPYLRSNHASRIMLESFGFSKERIEGFRRIVGERFNDHYHQGSIAIRPGIPELLRDVQAEPNLHLAIVTNSNTDAVRRKLATIPGTILDHTKIRTVGGAKKYVVGSTDQILSDDPLLDFIEGFYRIPPTLSIRGLARPVQLRRPFYYACLNRLRIEAGVKSWANVMVIGDVLEMDIAVVHALGGEFGLAANALTPAYEKAYVEKYPLGDVLNSPDDMRRFVFVG